MSNEILHRGYSGSIITGTYDGFTSSTITYPPGLWTIELDTGLMKITDGIHQYKDLLYRVDTTYTGLPLFFHFYHDTFIANPSYVSADQFSWHYGGIFVAAYEELVKEYTNENSKEVDEEVNGIKIKYKLTPKGYKICDATQQQNVIYIYNATGIAWYYLLDQGKKYFKLPRNSKLFQGSKDITEVRKEGSIQGSEGNNELMKTHKEYLYFFMGNSIHNRFENAVTSMKTTGGTFEGNVSYQVAEPLYTVDKGEDGTTTNTIHLDISKSNFFDIELTDKTEFIDPTKDVSEVASAGTTLLASSEEKKVTISVDKDLEPGSGIVVTIKVNCQIESTQITWPSNIKWVKTTSSDSTSPTVSKDHTCIVTLRTFDSGENWYGECIDVDNSSSSSSS